MCTREENIREITEFNYSSGDDSKKSVMDIEERIDLWLERKGVRPESPRYKMHSHLDRNRVAFSCLSMSNRG